DNRENRAILSDNDIAIGRKWELHGTALNDISRTRNDSAHGSSNKRITHARLSSLKHWLFQQKELQNIVELCQIHKNGKESLETMQAADEKMLKILEEKYK
ncbi:MAG: hypothetical protein IJ367_01785, partial [Clostridia bacterium]|nr:hypothetical protein [Clostridia bacterium]